MICPNCGSEIPSNFHFCGMCGEPLPVAEVPANVVAEQEAVSSSDALFTAFPAEPESSSSSGYAYPEETRGPEPLGEAQSEEATPVNGPGISGPSFLGLSEGTAESGEPYSYLLEDEPRRGHFGMVVLVIVLAILGAVAWRNRSAIGHYVANLRTPPASVYPNAADHSDTGVTSDVKPPEHAPVPPDQQIAAAPSTNSDQPQITVEEQKKQSATDENKQAAAPPERAAEQPSASESPAPRASADNSSKQAAPSDTSHSVEDNQPAPRSKPARRRSVAENQPKEERGARMLMLGENYLYGRTVPRNCDQALIYLKGAANAGNAEARSHLGALYSTGECVTRDRVAAYHWFALASRSEPANPWLESNLNMLWRDMSPDERRRVGAER